MTKLPPKYRFFLNHYQDIRFTRCPQCDQLMKVRKHPFLIHVDPMQPVLLNMAGKYCPQCDLLILHQDKVEQLLTFALLSNNPNLIGNEYLVLGTMERAASRKVREQRGDWQMLFDNLHDFKEVVLIEVEYPGWGPAGD